jgi:hypothetical protein
MASNSDTTDIFAEYSVNHRLESNFPVQRRLKLWKEFSANVKKRSVEVLGFCYRIDYSSGIHEEEEASFTPVSYRVP